MNRMINRPPATPGGVLLGGGSRGMPEDLLQEASKRLGIIALIGVVLWIVGVSLDHLAMWAMDPTDPRWRQLHIPDAFVVLGVLTSLSLFIYSRKSGRSDRFMLDLGLGYLIVTCLDIAIIGHWAPQGMDSVQPMFSWAGCLVLIFAAIIPNPPWKTLVAGLIAVSMNPVSMLIARARGAWMFDSIGDVILMHYPDYIMVGVSVVISRVVTRLGQHVTKAREMGSYHIGELLGRGGMGEVYLATHRMLARPAAIKLIRPEVIGGGDNDAGQLALKRFRREAEVASSLRSPHTVELYDFGVTEDQTVYYVMELLEGRDLETLVQDYGPVPAGRVIHILLQVCESLEEAHVRGLVHRDIKPANLHIGRLGLRHDFVKVLDFGLVKSVTGAGAESSLGTGVDVTPGTPAYMAPEMALGETIDARADLYALGCVAYFLLTGKAVFEATNALQAIARHLNDQPVPPSERGGVSIPPELERIVLALLAKRPGDRPGSAAEVARMLRAIEHEPWGEAQAAELWDSRKQGTGNRE